MTNQENTIALTIHVIIPLLGLIAYYLLIKKMERDKVIDIPKVSLLIVFANYGGLLLTLLTVAFWEWSGMASLGLFYLVLVAPFVMLLNSYFLHNKRSISKYHDAIYISGLAYFYFLIVFLVVIYVLFTMK